MPPQNKERRRVLAGAAVELVGLRGVHGLTHRAVDEQAGVPAGTTSNYFRTRDALLEAAMERLVDLHAQDMAAAASAEVGEVDLEVLVAVIGESLHGAVTAHRVRYLAVCELTLEATRNPVLQDAVDRLREAMVRTTHEQHRALGLPTSVEDVRTLVLLYGNALFGLLTTEPDRAAAHAVARAIVLGTLAAPTPAPSERSTPPGGGATPSAGPARRRRARA